MAEAIVLDGSPPAKGKDERALSPWSILRNSSKVSGSNLVGVLILFPVNILMARVLGPELWGVVGYVALWQMYAAFSRPGMFGAAYREMPALLSQGKTEEATRVQNVGLTGDGIYLVLPIGVMLLLAFLQKDVLLRNGLIAGAMVFGLSQTRDMLTGVQWAHQRFGLIAKINVLVTVVTTIFMLSTVRWLKYFAPILSPGVAALTVVIALRFGAPSIRFRFQPERREMVRLLKIGLPLGLSGLFYWGFRLADRTAVAVWLPLADLGYFSFVMQFINLAILLVSDFCNVVQPALWAELGKASHVQALGSEIRKISFTILLATCIGTNLAQAGFGALVYWFVPKFGPSVEIFEIVAFLLAVGTLAFVPTHLLNSARINRQKLLTMIWGLSLPFNFALAYVAIKMGWGLRGIAWNSVLAQGLASVIVLLFAQRYIFDNRRSQLRFNGLMFGALLITFGVFGLYHLAPLAYGVGESVIAKLALRVAVMGVVWGSILGLACLRRSRGLQFVWGQ